LSLLSGDGHGISCSVELILSAPALGAPNKEQPFVTNPTTRRRPGPGRAALFLRLAAVAVGLCASYASCEARPADASQGEKLAKRWCASCHIVANDQKQGADNVPTFASIAKKPGFSTAKIARFLMDPHPKMPDMQLSRDETKDLGAYIASLAR
jgi:mono/diheme cytochrome c family protein